MALLINIISLLPLLSFLFTALVPSPVNAISPFNDLSSRHDLSDHIGLAKRRRSRRDLNKRCPAPEPSHSTSSPSTGSVNVEGLRGGRGKYGLGWGRGGNPEEFVSEKTNMLYTWTPRCPPASQRHGVPCCPMLWGEKSVSLFRELVHEGYSTCVMGFNEPELGYPQSSMSPGQAASLWKELIAPLRNKGYNRFFLPALATDDGAQNWMNEFLRECDCEDYVTEFAIHVYDVDADKAIQIIEKFHNEFPRWPVAITELGCQAFYGAQRSCSESEVRAFIKGVTDWALNTEWVTTVAYFGMFTAGNSPGGVDGMNAMIEGNGQSPNSLFNYWINL